MQVRRIAYELGLFYSEDHGHPVLSYGDKSVVFVLGLNNFFDGTIHKNESLNLNKSVYVFSWGVTSLFQYAEFRRRVTQLFPAPLNPRRYYPIFELPNALCEELLEKHVLLLDGSLEKATSFDFYYWIIDKGHGLFNICLNTYFDALLFLPTRIAIKETGKLLRM